MRLGDSGPTALELLKNETRIVFDGKCGSADPCADTTLSGDGMIGSGRQHTALPALELFENDGVGGN